MDIAAYAGEFTVSPIPLEMSMNFCSHKCAYCFANLNQPQRKLDANAAINQIKNCHKGKGLTAYLLANEYPVLLSNRVDPFAKTNYRQALSFIELFNANGNKIAFQTKGGEGIDEALSLIDYKAHWYISIGFWDDKHRKAIEPGAPSISSRIDLAHKLTELGHHVAIGINPIVEEWLPMYDFYSLVKKIGEIGVKDVWMQNLHLNDKQIARMSNKERQSIGDSVIVDAKKRIQNFTYSDYCAKELNNLGFNVFSGNSAPTISNYHDWARDNYKSIPTLSDFIQICFKYLPNGGVVRFSDYLNVMSKPFYFQQFSEVDGYAYRIARNVYREFVDKPIKRLVDILKFYWEHENVSKSPFNNDLFGNIKVDGRLVTDKDDDTWVGYFNAGNISDFKFEYTPEQLSDMPQLRDFLTPKTK